MNCSIDLIRSRHHRETSHDAADLEFADAANDERTEHSPERLMLSTEVQDRVNTAMASLSRMERAAFVLRHFEGLSIDEICQALGLKAVLPPPEEKKEAREHPDDHGRGW